MFVTHSYWLIILPLLFHNSSHLKQTELQHHEMWWNQVSPSSPYLYNLYGGVNAPSRIKARLYIKQAKYTSMLDIPCGFCAEYQGLINDKISINYYGIDISQSLIAHAKQQGINVLQANIEKIPYSDASFDLCYARHIFEHLAYYKKALSELIRVAKKEILIIFSLKPHNQPDSIQLLYNSFYYNQYNKKKFEEYILLHKKVKNIIWENINECEIMLHIYL